jgi:hypothetical protein
MRVFAALFLVAAAAVSVVQGITQGKPVCLQQFCTRI